MQAAQIDQTITDVAGDKGIKPGLLEYHVRELHGWNPGEVGYDDAVREAADCKREECVLLLDEVVAASRPTPRDHVVSATETCWCNPETVHVPIAFTDVPF